MTHDSYPHADEETFTNDDVGEAHGARRRGVVRVTDRVHRDHLRSNETLPFDYGVEVERRTCFLTRWWKWKWEEVSLAKGTATTQRVMRCKMRKKL